MILYFINYYISQYKTLKKIKFTLSILEIWAHYGSYNGQIHT